MQQNYKKQAAIEAAKKVKPHQIIGLGGGGTIAYLAEELAADIHKAQTLRFVSSSVETENLLVDLGLNVIDAATLTSIDVYFDGCDQLDKELNALKSGGGIHTYEKALACMAKEFILLGDVEKYTDQLNINCLFTVEVVPYAIGFISDTLKKSFDVLHVVVRTDTDKKNISTKRGGALLDVKFQNFPELSALNQIKIWPGIIDHSLFYKMATAAILCGPEGINHLSIS
ncbi:ribose 5-phosphate isomerase A [Chryseobacterium nematophagum]|uniref:Ribose 5-phosphate isomerase A n=1 Tax=Chryseobacterium nematophagum TaxID=2305228 RepID=A0A3M7L750_9FLAO|nr:ribose 5-phosphate isomerase A [Chryseobacterium nematophagum]RMZ58427.1 ribose 5-phosphate isomerase A [Chryseobacterium nematophagum]